MKSNFLRFAESSIRQRTPCRRVSPRVDGFSLLEVILALALSVLVISAVMTAIYLHLNVLDKRRGKIERAQLARNLLSTIASDIRSAVQYKPVDVSQLEQMMAGGDLASMAGTPGGDAALGALADSEMGDDLGSPLDLTNGANMLTGGLEGGALGDATAGIDGMGSSASQDIASTVAPPTEPGIYGNQFELQVDTSRLPRKDQYNPLTISSGSSLTDIPSDIKTVAYYVTVGGESIAADDSGFDSLSPTTGLVRREVDRAVSRFATNNGGTMEGLGNTDIVAAEVSQIEFRYFDGTDWVTEWDSDELGALPKAIEIVIVLSELDEQGVAVTIDEEEAMIDNMYRLVVFLPAAEPAEEEEPLEEELPSDEAPPADTGDADAGAAPTGGGDSSGGAGSIDPTAPTGGFSSGAGATDGGLDRN